MTNSNESNETKVNGKKVDNILIDQSGKGIDDDRKMIIDFNIVDMLVNKYDEARKEVSAIRDAKSDYSRDDLRLTKKYFRKHLRRNEDEFTQRVREIIEVAKLSEDDTTFYLMVGGYDQGETVYIEQDIKRVLKRYNEKLVKFLKLDKKVLQRILVAADEQVFLN